MTPSSAAPISSSTFIQRLQQPAKIERATPQLQCYTTQTPHRERVEGYIADAFRREYDARIDHFLPVLLTLETNGVIDAALGIRCAERGELFVEHYLDQPLDAELAQRGLAHRAVVEIGNLVATRKGSSQLLFMLLAELLHLLQRDTGVFTATPQVMQLLGKLGCELTTLCVADGRRLGAQLPQWGSYYATEPQVIAADVATTNANLQARPVLARTFEQFKPQLLRITALLRGDHSKPLAATG
jgi:hypothetical protein